MLKLLLGLHLAFSVPAAARSRSGRWLDYEAAGGRAEQADRAVENTALLNRLLADLKPQEGLRR